MMTLLANYNDKSVLTGQSHNCVNISVKVIERLKLLKVCCILALLEITSDVGCMLEMIVRNVKAVTEKDKSCSDLGP